MSTLVVQRTVTITSPNGLHARPAELIARTAMRYESEIELLQEGVRVDAKSILHVLTLGAAQDSELVLEARGPDAEHAIEALADLVARDFEPDESLSQDRSG